MDSTVLKGLSVLEALACCSESRGVTELAKEVGLTKSNVHRLLQTLISAGYVRNCLGSGRYELTLKVWELGVGVIGRLDVKRVAIEHMENLARLTGETAHLSILDGCEVVYVDKVDSPLPVRAYSAIGGRAPAYCVATGKALLAYASKEVIDKVSRQLRAYTPLTVTSPHEFQTELRRVREAGYATNKGEWREGVGGIAAPIRDSRDSVIAAVGISGPVARLKPRAVKRLASTVIEVAQRIGSQLGSSAERNAIKKGSHVGEQIRRIGP